MYILGINGSPRIGGNCDILLDKALEGARSQGADVEKIILNTFKMSGCQECPNMPDDGTCIVDDDMQVVFDKIKKADALILASPIFFGSVSAQTKMMIDRFQCLWRAKYIIRDKTPPLDPSLKGMGKVYPSGSDVSGGSTCAREGIPVDKVCEYKKKTGAFISVEASNRADFFDNAKAIVKNLFAAINAEYREELLCQGVDEKAKILKYPDFLNKAFELGARIVKEV